uniref:DegT/DnrJ/EryC1/StrS aminotransferase family protein n=1 Tax=Candidatus Kentrum sp. FW TaxID=2126338 RepID=A0A450TCV7_9GAMM|nr:MAG: DegT/DnrJ/EryC1/StrS aminotransferase family protein [Candidatus Kentron sp. FW]
MRKDNIFVTKPVLPPLDEFIPYLERIWDSKILTNGGGFHQQLEKKLCEHLGVEHICLFTNGTIALIIALKALRITGEVITTPYSFVATSHSLLWNGIKPVFADIDPKTPYAGAKAATYLFLVPMASTARGRIHLVPTLLSLW